MPMLKSGLEDKSREITEDGKEVSYIDNNLVS